MQNFFSLTLPTINKIWFQDESREGRLNRANKTYVKRNLSSFYNMSFSPIQLEEYKTRDGLCKNTSKKKYELWSWIQLFSSFKFAIMIFRCLPV